ncbi:MAG TPA: hypothetical protein VFX50_12820, partial [Gemmatimonadales bacterium]|nr:hypothetical protein [Gemmatimonadales bacterium]
MPNRPTARFGRSVEPWIWAALVAVAFVAAFAVRGAIADDAFIYLRFAENLARGDGWSFNAGETISGTTSPLYTLLLGLAVAIRVPGPDALVLLFGAGLALTAGALHAALRADGRLLALATALVAITWPPLLRAVGLETSLLLATVALAAVAAERGRWRWAGGFAGACALARPEGIALVAVLALVAGSDRRESHSPAGPRYRALAGSFLAVVVPWMIAAGFLFGGLVPHSARVKAIQGSIEWWTQEGTWLATFLRQVPGTPWIFLLVALGARRAVRHARAGRTFALIVVLFGLSQVLGYAILHAPPGYLWYYAPGNLALVVLAACGLREVELLARRLPWMRLRVESPRTPAR